MTSATDKSIDRLVVNAKTRRRNSSVGKIDLGDTVPGFAAMPESAASKNEAKKRMKALTGDSKKDSDLLWKVWFSYREMNYRHSWLTPFFILVCVYSAYFLSGNRTESNPLHMFVAISYQVDGTDSYAKGIKDLSFVFFYMIFFTFLREFLMDVVIRPFTVYLNVTSEHRQKRMLEQITYPDITNPFLFKIFYLGQAAFWAQQACVLVLQLEKPRKDYKELVFHHIVTLLLIWSSYVFHFTKMGLAIYITMDVSDFFLSLSKTLNYLNSVFTPFVFGLFVFFWIYLRHVVNIRILWSVLTEFRHEGNYVLNFATQQYKCWISLPIVFVLIAALQLVNLYWLFLILRILYRLIWQGIQKDERSDSDSDESAENEESKEKCE
ncbi:unnamed protein product [Saccharomyces cerevisiae]|nr:unnamed protein product [Saccharomyces cerevisiae]GMC41427.1 unnamed protein product [Saccharomyces cerevisiae]GMC46046.1 unnamed protein product [Saccharomyces cerevisiae]